MQNSQFYNIKFNLVKYVMICDFSEVNIKLDFTSNIWLIFKTFHK